MYGIDHDNLILLDRIVDLRLVSDGNFGTMRNNGTWTGIIGDLQHMKADLGIIRGGGGVQLIETCAGIFRKCYWTFEICTV